MSSHLKLTFLPITYVFGMSLSSSKVSYFFDMSVRYIFGMSHLLHKTYLLFWYVLKLCFRYVLSNQKIKYFLGMFLTYVLGMF